MRVAVCGAGVLLLLLASLQVVAAVNVEQKLVEDIKSAQRQLAATAKTVANERRKLVDALNILEREVLTLRDKTAVARRLADEQTLSLSKLQQRLDSWRQQYSYQRNLLTQFLRQQSTGPVPETIDAQIGAVRTVADRLQKQFYPDWQLRELVTANGELQALDTLAVGPVVWYWNADAGSAGLAAREDGALKAEVSLNSGAGDGIAELRETGAGEITFDPTLSRAMARAQQTESLPEHIAKGGLWAVPILLFALFALAVALLKSWQLWRLPKVSQFVPSGKVPAGLGAMQQQLLDISIAETAPQARDDRLFAALQNQKHWLDRWIGAIAITASVSPLLGLLGTVSGMIETFKMMTLFGSGDPEVVSGGIAQALITTEMGLVVAIPALVLNALLSRRAKSYYRELESFALLISQQSTSAQVVESVAQQQPVQHFATNGIEAPA